MSVDTNDAVTPDPHDADGSTAGESLVEQPGDAAEPAGDEAGLVVADIDLLQRERDDLLGTSQRLQADFENFKKRIERERYDHFRYATFELVGRILPVLDNFERAITAARSGVPDDALVEGVTLIQRQLLAELETEGLRSMGTVGELFDPERHEAVATDPDSPFPPHTVTHIFTPYQLATLIA